MRISRKKRRHKEIAQYRMELRQNKVPLKCCAFEYEGKDIVQLYVHWQGHRLIIIQSTLDEVLSEVSKLHTHISENVKPHLASYQRQAAVQEVEKMIRER